MKKGEIIEDVYYTMEKYSYLMADIDLLKKDPFGKRRIDTVRILDAKCWLIHLQQVEKKSYSSIHSIRGVLRPAFQLAVDDDLIRKNPFQFQLMEVVVNDSVTREAISRAEERKFLRFVKEDPHFCRYYEGIYQKLARILLPLQVGDELQKKKNRTLVL